MAEMSDQIALARQLSTAQSSGLPQTVGTVRDALKMIASLDQARRAALHWRLALNALEYAQMVADPEVIDLATDALENAITSDQSRASISKPTKPEPH